MKTYPITGLIENLKKDDTNLLREILLHLRANHQETFADLLINLSDTDNYELLKKLFEYLISKTEYFNLLPSFCQIDLKNPDNFHYIEQNIQSDFLPLAQRNALYWIAVSLTTRYNEINFSNQKKTYLTLLTSAKKELNLSGLEELDINVEEKRVFIYTNQFFFEEHAPTKIVNKWADSFKELGYKVIIISTTTSKFAYPTNASYNYGKLLDVGESKELRDGIFLIEIGGNLVMQDIYIKLIEAVYMNDKDKYILVGDSCLAFDILPFQHKFVVPTSAPKEHILTTAHTYILNSISNLKNVNDNNMTMIIGPNNYTNLQFAKFTPPEFKDGNIINIAVVGNRLQNELDNSFWEEMKTLLNQNTHIHIHIIGDTHNAFKDKKSNPRIIFSGFQADLSQYLSNMHFFLNPDRSGGGQSAIYAVKLGIPIITLPDNDVYYAIKRKYSLSHLNQTYSFIHKYMNDPIYKTEIDTINLDLNNLYNKSHAEVTQACKEILDLQ